MAEVQDIKIKLENYYGPLDLLLYLVKEEELDVARLRVSDVVEQYIGILEAARTLDMDLAGEFVVLSSQLLLLKSRRVVPAAGEAPAEAAEEQAISLDLIRRLLEYKRFKDLAAGLGRRFEDVARRHGRPELVLEQTDDAVEVDLWKLVSAFAKVSQSLKLEAGLNIIYQDIPIETMMSQVLAKVREHKKILFRELVGDSRDRLQVVFHFLALLELVKEQAVEAKQEEGTDDILISLR